MAFMSCRLCSFACDEYKLLYDANGGASEVYETVIKYFHASLLDDAEAASTVKVICLDCWQHISDFHNFQQWILNARTQEDLKCIIKTEDLSEQNIPIKSNESMAKSSDCNDYVSYTEEISMFECDNCKELFQSFNELETHLKLCQNSMTSDNIIDAKHNNLYKSKIVKVINVRDKNTYTCKTCEASFSQYGNLRRHVRKHHAVQPLLKWICKYCNKLFKKKTLLEMHKNKQHKHQMGDSTQNVAKQIIDDKENNTRSSSEPKTDKNEKQLLATEPACSSKFPVKVNSEEELVEDRTSAEAKQPKTEIHIPALEIIDVKSEVATDEESDNDFDNTNANESYSESEEKVNDLELQIDYLKCPRCSQIVCNCIQLKEHFELKHPDERCYINCCNLTLYEERSILEHLRFHENPNAFKCLECGKCFKGSKGLSSHKLQVHSENRSIYHLHLCCCKTGEERLKQTLAKGQQQQQQMEYDTRVCCQRKKKILDDDELIAKWRKKITCEICKAKFPYYSLMRSHSYYEHPGEKCYISCCQRKMSRISDAIEHIRFHLNPHLYRCKKCSVDFSGKSTLAKHMRNAHKESSPKHQWACDECDKTFEIRQILTRHKNVCHSKNKKSN